MKTPEEYLKEKYPYTYEELCWGAIDESVIFDVMESYAKERAVEFIQYHYEESGAILTDKFTNELYDTFIKEPKKQILDPEIDDEAFKPRHNLLPNPNPDKQS